EFRPYVRSRNRGRTRVWRMAARRGRRSRDGDGSGALGPRGPARASGCRTRTSTPWSRGPPGRRAGAFTRANPRVDAGRQEGSSRAGPVRPAARDRGRGSQGRYRRQSRPGNHRRLQRAPSGCCVAVVIRSCKALFLRGSTGIFQSSLKNIVHSGEMHANAFNIRDLAVDLSVSPPAQGLYDPAHEHDSCGVGFVAHIKGKKSHSIVEQGLTVLKNLTHRGAVGWDPKLSDGAGCLIQIPDRFLREELAQQNIHLPPPGQYGVGMIFLPRDPASRLACEYEIERAIKDEGQVLLGWRDVPVDNSDLAEPAKKLEPVIRQVFIGRGRGVTVTDALERKLYVIRKSSGHAIQALRLSHGKEFYVASMSARTVCYKGMLLAYQVGEYYLDLKDARVESAIAMV